MKLSKNKHSEVSNRINRHFTYGTAMRPVDKEIFPRNFVGTKFIKHRMYVRAKFIVYQLFYSSTMDAAGFEIFYDDGELKKLVLLKAPFYELVRRMFDWCDKHEDSMKLKTLAV